MTTWDNVRSILEAYDLKPDGGDQWRCNNPWRVGADSRSFRIQISPDGEQGVYFDHNSGEKGTLYSLAKQIHATIERDVLEVADSKRAYRDLAEYAQLKGVPLEAFTALHWKTEVVTVKQRKAIEFPTRTGKRWRFIDGESPSFISEPGYQRCWYSLERAVKTANETQQPLVMCNGEPSVVVGQWYGVAATTISGSGETSNYPPEMLKHLKSLYDGQVLLALDCDYKGAKSAMKLAAQMKAVGINVKAIDLMLGDKGDLADFCKLHQQDARANLLALPELKAPEPQLKLAQPATPPVPVVNYCSDIDALSSYMDEINGDSLPQTPPLINPYPFLHRFGGLGRVIPAGKLVFFASISGGTKTIGFETGWEKYQNMGVHNVIYSPEWVDAINGATEMAARAVQRAGGVQFNDWMLNSLHNQEQGFRIKTNAGKALSSAEISKSMALAGQLMHRPGRAFFVKDAGLSTEKLCEQVEMICDLEAEKGNIIRAWWVDFAQLLWLETRDTGGRMWIETAINMIKDTCRRKGLVGFVSTQMRKDDAESAKEGGKLSSDMMQWLSEQQANFVMAFVPKFEDGQRVMIPDINNPGRNIGLLRGRVLKNSMAELTDEEFDIPVDFMRLTWMENANVRNINLTTGSTRDYRVGG